MGLHDKDSEEFLVRLLGRYYKSASQVAAHSLHEKRQRHETEGQTIAVTNVHEWARELAATEHVLHPWTAIPRTAFAPPLTDQVMEHPTWEELEAICREIHDLYERSDDVLLTLREQQYVDVLVEIAGRTLVQANKAQDLDASGVRIKLLQVAVRPTAQWRRLAFTLFLNFSVASLRAVLPKPESSTCIARMEQLEMHLFHLLREMLGKAVAVSTTSSAAEPMATKCHNMDWISQAVGCLELFVIKADGNYSMHRLQALDEHTLLFLAAEASNRDIADLELQLKVMELVVAAMYASSISCAGNSSSEGHQSKNDHIMWNYGLPMAAIEQFMSLDLLLYHFYCSPVARLQRLTCMVLVDLVCDQLRRTATRESISTLGLEQIWWSFVEWEHPSLDIRQTLLSPYVSSARIVKQLASTCPLVSERQLTAFVSQFRLTAQVDAYFGVNPSLEKALKHAVNHDRTDAFEELLGQVSSLLLSNRPVDRFRGERWLAELLTSGRDDDAFSSYDSKTPMAIDPGPNESGVLLTRPKSTSAVKSGEDLEETFCFDERGEIDQAAQAKFWDLSGPTNAVGLRVSFVNVLALYIRRKLLLSSGKADTSMIHELNTCVRVLLDHKESDVSVLVPLMLLILDICQCELSYIDKRWQQRDAATSDQLSKTSHCLAMSDSLAARVLNGKVALKKSSVLQIDAVFFMHVLIMLHEQLDTPSIAAGRRICCGVDSSLVGDVAACTALVLMHVFAANKAALDKVGGLTVLPPLLHTCDTRVAMFIAKLISKLIKEADETHYTAFLRELYAACVEADNEHALDNSYLHTQALLHNCDGYIATARYNRYDS